MSIEQVLRKIVEKALQDEGLDIVEIDYRDYERKNRIGITAIVHALLNSEEVSVVSKAHISDLEKRVEAQGKVVEAAKRIVADDSPFEDLEDCLFILHNALREVESDYVP